MRSVSEGEMGKKSEKIKRKGRREKKKVKGYLRAGVGSIFILFKASKNFGEN